MHADREDQLVHCVAASIELLLVLQQLIYSQQIMRRMTEMIFSSDGERIVVE